MTARARATKATRRGMILPLVLIGMLLMLTFSASLQQVAWRAVRGARAENPWIGHEPRDGSRVPLSDHDAVGIDVVF